MAGYERTERIQALEGKRISEESLRRELDKAVPGARWDVERTKDRIILFTETDSTYITIVLSVSRRNRKNYIISRVCVSDTIW